MLGVGLLGVVGFEGQAAVRLLLFDVVCEVAERLQDRSLASIQLMRERMASRSIPTRPRAALARSGARWPYTALVSWP